MPFREDKMIQDDPDERITSPTGAVRQVATARGEKAVHYETISPTFLKSLAETLGEGAEKYGNENWRLGLSWRETMRHLLGHLYAFLDGDTSEDHLGHAAANLMFLSHYQEHNPEGNDLPLTELAKRKMERDVLTPGNN